MIRYLTPVPSRAASGKVAEMYQQISREFLLGEPLTLHSCVPDLLAGVWSTFRETFIAGHVNRALKEAVAVAVSRSNQCPFCMDAHAMALRSTSRGAGIGWLKGDVTEKIEDPELRAVVRWAESATGSGTDPLSAPPVASEDVPEIMGALVWMHYTNRMVNLFIGEGLIPVSTQRFGLRSLLEKVGSRYFHRMFNQKVTPGESLVFLDASEAETPRDLAWTAGSPVLARAFGGLVKAVEQGAEASVPEAARSWFLGHSKQSGEQAVGISRRWLDDALEGLDEGFHPIGRLLLLASRAPYQLMDEDIEAFRMERPEERDLLQTAAWASLTAARRIAAPGN